MEIIHNQDTYEELTIKLKNLYDNIENLENRVSGISDLVYSMKLQSTSKIIEDAIDDIENELFAEYLSELEDFINLITSNNYEMINLDHKMRNSVNGGSDVL